MSMYSQDSHKFQIQVWGPVLLSKGLELFFFFLSNLPNYIVGLLFLVENGFEIPVFKTHLKEP